MTQKPTVFVVDDDPEVNIRKGQPEYHEGELGQFILSLSSRTNKDVTVTLEYPSYSDPITRTIDLTESEKIIDLRIPDDGFYGWNYGTHIGIVDVDNGVIGPDGELTFEVLDGQSPPTISIEATWRSKWRTT